MRFVQCDWRRGQSRLPRKSSALPAGNSFWRRTGRICASPPACCARIRVSLLSQSSRSLSASAPTPRFSASFMPCFSGLFPTRIPGNWSPCSSPTYRRESRKLAAHTLISQRGRNRTALSVSLPARRSTPSPLRAAANLLSSRPLLSLRRCFRFCKPKLSSGALLAPKTAFAARLRSSS